VANPQCQVLFFSTLREVTGLESLTWSLPAEPVTAGQILSKLADRFPALRPYLPNILVAVNQEFVKLDQPVTAGSELAFMPPLQGG
jgi:molybdopterin synthase catalytic subunit